ncbi:BF3164 family lipoprotein [Algoriphagus aquaeductus]|uniref:BF3164 family lipoprotein n=1 Tax=Algoriphagus aquaeductus TaxID=475299 RepID=UPI0015EC3132|nr:BF3164 family lipoprotein [Algoriphagus aquaeductus]
MKGHKYSFPKILNPRGITIIGSKAVVFERKNTSDDKFHIIDLQEEAYLRSKGIDGMGPGEITVITQLEALQDPRKILTYDPELNVFSVFDLSDSSRLAERQFRAPATAFFITDAAFTSDTSFIAHVVDGWTKYLHLTISGDTLSTFGNWKNMIKGRELPNGYKEEELDANLVSNVFQGPLRVNNSRTYAVKAGLKVDYIDIVRLSDQSITTIIGPESTIQDFRIGNSGGYQMPTFPLETSTTRYRDVFAGENSLFVLFSGKSYTAISEMTNLNRIFEFDYSGKPLAQYQLDFPLFGFAVDERNRRIYGVTTDEQPNLVRFDY